jgi:hypothetical protein
MVADTLAGLKGIIEGAGVAERMALVGSTFEYIEVLEDHAEAHWWPADPEGVSRPNDVSGWLRR